MQFISYTKSPGVLLPTYIEDWLPEGHLSLLVDMVVDKLSLSCITTKYKDEGRPAYHPRMMLKVLFYAYATGTRSSRQIAKRLRTDIAYIYLSGRQFPDFRTISDFRKNNIQELHKLFVRVVLLCKELDLIKLGHIAIDGVRIKGNASKKRTKTKEKLDEEIKNIFAEAEATDRIEDEEKAEDEKEKVFENKQELCKKLEYAQKVIEKLDLDKINLTDPEATFQRTEYGLQPGYNGEIAVDNENQIIVAEDVVNESNDTEQLIPVLEQVKENTDDNPDKASADGGFYCGENLEYLKKEQIDGYIPDCRKENKDANNPSVLGHPYCKENFQYNKKEDVYECPEGKKLECVKVEKEVGNYGIEKEVKTYQGKECSLCEKQNQCISPSNKSGNRSIKREEYEDLRKSMKEKMNTEEGKEIYKVRGPTVEGVFGYIKGFLGYRQFSLRGLNKVKGEFSLICIAYNITRIWKIKGREMIRLWRDGIEDLTYFYSKTVFIIKKCLTIKFSHFNVRGFV